MCILWVKAWLPGPRDKTQDTKPKSSDDITFIYEVINTVTRNPTECEGMFPQRTVGLVRGQGGSVGCIELAHS